jgi:hypothetical protein
MTCHFHAVRNRFWWRRVPLYVGHPDDPLLSSQPGHDDPTPYGWIVDLKADPEGIWIKVQVTPAGRELLRRGLYRYLSPRWSVRQIALHRFEPIRLVSVGLTNTPQLVVDPLTVTEPPEHWINPVAKVALKGRPRTKELEFDRTRKRSVQDFVSRVYKRMDRLGESYAEAWAWVKKHENIE